MSVLEKKPYIESLFEGLSASQYAAIKSALNTKETSNKYSLVDVNNFTLITSSLSGEVKRCLCAVSPTVFVDGVLIYKDASNVAMIGFIPNKCGGNLPLFKLNLTTRKPEPIGEKLSIEELRRILDDGTEHAGDEWVEKMRTVVNTSLGNVHFTNTNGFTELNHLKVNELTFQDTPEGETPNIKIVNADLKVGAAGETRKIYLNGVKLGIDANGRLGQWVSDGGRHTSYDQLVVGQTYHVVIPAGKAFSAQREYIYGTVSNFEPSTAIGTRSIGAASAGFGLSSGPEMANGYINTVEETQNIITQNLACEFDITISSIYHETDTEKLYQYIQKEEEFTFKKFLVEGEN